MAVIGIHRPDYIFDIPEIDELHTVLDRSAGPGLLGGLQV